MRKLKENTKGFFKYRNSKRKTKENMSLLLNEVKEVTEDNEKVDLLNAIFGSVFIAETASQKFPDHESKRLGKGRLLLSQIRSGQRRSMQT